MIKTVSVALGLLVSCNWLSYSEPVSVETYQQKIDESFILCMQNNGGDLILDSANLPGNEIVNKVKEQIAQRIAENNFPSVEKGSKTDDNLVEIFKSTLTQSGFLGGEFQFKEILKDHPEAFSYLPEKIVEDYCLDIQTAQFWERMNPSETEVPSILEQVKVIKEKIRSNLLSVFGSDHEGDIQKVLDLQFMKYEMGPTSLMSPWAKSLLPRERLANLEKRIEEIKENEGSAIPAQAAPPREITDNDIKKKIFFTARIEPLLHRYLWSLLGAIRDEYIPLLPSEIHNLQPSPRLSELQKIYSEDVIKYN